MDETPESLSSDSFDETHITPPEIDSTAITSTATTTTTTTHTTNVDSESTTTSTNPPTNPSNPSNPSNPPRDQEEEEEEEEYTVEEYAQVVTVILAPVSITIFIVVWIIQLLHVPSEGVMDEYFFYKQSGSDSDTVKFFGSILNALVLVLMIVVVTVIFVCLYKYRCIKVIYAWLIGSTGLLLGVFGAIFFYYILLAYNVPMDSITFSLLIWNFAVGGLLSIFWYAPQKINQGYLILISVFLAVFFTQFPDWTTWAFLAAIAIYDVFAVLCPSGPLRILVNLSQERQEPIPALLYSGMLSFMATDEEEMGAGLILRKREREDERANENNMVELSSLGQNSEDRPERDSQQPPPPPPPPSQDPPPARRKGVKLGLGDFIFYSVLVGRAAMYDILSVFTCFICIITGLFFTLLLLALYNKALPALPISITLGMLCFFATQEFLLPFVVTLGRNSIFI